MEGDKAGDAPGANILHILFLGCGLVLGMFFFFWGAFFFFFGLWALCLLSFQLTWCGWVVFLWWCGGVFVVFLWWCLCGDVFVVVWLGGVFVVVW